jgi:hypothetical protein
MPRVTGCPQSVTRITLHLREEWVIPFEGRRYVFLDLVQPLVTKLVKDSGGDRKIPARLSQLIHRGQYAIRELYGLPVLNIDEPNTIPTSLPFRLVVGRGKDTLRQGV